MNIKELIRKACFGIAIVALSAQPAAAATSGTVTISGTVNEVHDIAVSNTGAEAFTNLGNATNTDVKVGQIVLTSNADNAFKITFSDPDGAVLQKDGTETASDKTLPYTVKLSTPTGTLAPGLTDPTFSAVSPDSDGESYSWTGTPTGITSSRKYDIDVTVNSKTVLTGSYQTTLTVAIADA